MVKIEIEGPALLWYTSRLNFASTVYWGSRLGSSSAPEFIAPKGFWIMFTQMFGGLPEMLLWEARDGL